MKKHIIVMATIGLLILPTIMTSTFASNNIYDKYDDSLDMLIFISPQYSNNFLIKWAINRYIDAVEEDIGWNTKTIKITSEMNDFRKIDQVIESYYENYTIKACIMVGEDIDIALGADCDYNEQPSTVPWYTTGGENAYEIVEAGINLRPYQTDICISLIYPTSEQCYLRKTLQIVKVFNKFSKNRDVSYNGNILFYEASDFCMDKEHILNQYGNLTYKKDPNLSHIIQSFKNSYSIYYTHGHSNPSRTKINATSKDKYHKNFYARYLDFIDTPIYMAGGCYVGGWWSDYPDNNHLDPSIDRLLYPHYSSRIFTAKKIRVMVLGYPFQGGYSYSVSFVENAIPDLINGSTIAESMIGDICSSVTIYGDPTFHFTIN